MTDPVTSSPGSYSAHSRAITAGAFAAIVALLMAISLADHGFTGDVLMDLNIGQWILVHGHVPLHNHFTQALAGRPFSDTEWAFSLYVAWVYQWGGRLAVYASLIPFLVGVGAFIGGWLSRWAGWRGTLLAVGAGLGLMITSNPRPQLFSYVTFALGLWAVLQARRHHWG